MDEDHVLYALEHGSPAGKADAIAALRRSVTEQDGHLLIANVKKLFGVLKNALADKTNWNVSLQVLRLLTDIIPDCDTDLENYLSIVVGAVVELLGDPKADLRHTSTITLALMLQHVQNIDSIGQALIQVGLENEKVAVRNATALVICDLINRQTCERLDVPALLDALVDRLQDKSDRVTKSAIIALAHMRTLLGDNFLRHINSMAPSLQQQYSLHSAAINAGAAAAGSGKRVRRRSADQTARSVQRRSAGNDYAVSSQEAAQQSTSVPAASVPPPPGALAALPAARHRSSSETASAERAVRRSGPGLAQRVEYGLIPAPLFASLLDRVNWNVRLGAIKELHEMVLQLQDVRPILPSVSALFRFLTNLSDDANYPVAQQAMQTIAALVYKVGADVAPAELVLQRAMVTKLGHKHAPMRAAAARVLRALMEAMSATHVLKTLLPSIHDRSGRVREELLNLITCVLLAMPLATQSPDFPWLSVARTCLQGLRDTRGRVCFAAMEALAVLNRIRGQDLIPLVGQLPPELRQAVQLRFADPSLPGVNDEGITVLHCMRSDGADRLGPASVPAGYDASSVSAAGAEDWARVSAGSSASSSRRHRSSSASASRPLSSRGAMPWAESNTPPRRRAVSGSSRRPGHHRYSETGGSGTNVDVSPPLQQRQRSKSYSSTMRHSDAFLNDLDQADRSYQASSSQQIPSDRSVGSAVSTGSTHSAYSHVTAASHGRNSGGGGYADAHRRKRQQQQQHQQQSAQQYEFESGADTGYTATLGPRRGRSVSSRESGRTEYGNVMPQRRSSIGSTGGGASDHDYVPSFRSSNVSGASAVSEASFASSQPPGRRRASIVQQSPPPVIAAAARGTSPSRVRVGGFNPSYEPSTPSVPDMPGGTGDRYYMEQTRSWLATKDVASPLTSAAASSRHEPVRARRKTVSSAEGMSSTRQAAKPSAVLPPVADDGDAADQYHYRRSDEPLSRSQPLPTKPSPPTSPHAATAPNPRSVPADERPLPALARANARSADSAGAACWESMGPNSDPSKFQYSTMQSNLAGVKQTARAMRTGSADMVRRRRTTSDSATPARAAQSARPMRTRTHADDAGQYQQRQPAQTRPLENEEEEEGDSFDVESTLASSSISSSSPLGSSQDSNGSGPRRRRATVDNGQDLHRRVLKIKRTDDPTAQSLEGLNHSAGGAVSSDMGSTNDSTRSVQTTRPRRHTDSARRVRSARIGAHSSPQHSHRSAFNDTGSYQEIATHELEPLPGAEAALNKALAQIVSNNQTDWVQTCDALVIVRRAVVHQPQVVAQDLHKVVLKVCVALQNLRSQVNKTAIQTFSEMFQFLKRRMDAELETVVPVMLKKFGETNQFTQNLAQECLEVMIGNVSEARALNALLMQSKHINSSIVARVSRILMLMCEKGRTRLCKGKDGGRLITELARLMEDGNPDTRESSRIAMALLASGSDLDPLFNKHLSDRKAQSVRKKLDSMRSEGEYPYGGSLTSLRVGAAAPAAASGLPSSRRRTKSTNSRRLSTTSSGSSIGLVGSGNASTSGSGSSMRPGSRDSGDGMTRQISTDDVSEMMSASNFAGLNSSGGKPRGGSKTRARSASNGAGAAGGHAASLLSTGRQPDAFESIPSIITKLGTHDWQHRLQALTSLEELALKYVDALVRHGKVHTIIDAYCSRLPDQNVKVTQAALQSVRSVIIAFGDHLEPTLTNLITSLASNLASSNAKVYNLTSDVADVLIEHVNAALLIQPWCQFVLFANPRQKPVMLEKLCSLVPLVWRKRSNLVIKHAVPLAFRLIEDSSAHLRAANARIITTLYQLMGESLFDHTGSIPMASRSKIRALIDAAQ